MIYTIKNTGAGTITVDPTGAEAVDGTASATVSLTVSKSTVSLISDGVGWQILSKYL